MNVVGCSCNKCKDACSYKKFLEKKTTMLQHVDEFCIIKKQSMFFK